MEIEQKIQSKIEKLCQKGDKLANKEKYEKAIRVYVDALSLVPEPITDYEASTWILTAIGDAYFLMENYESSLKPFQDVMLCPNAIGNPFIHMRLGQCQYELKNFDKAADELTRAYGIEGEKIFENDDPKYFEFLKTKIKI